MVVFIAVSRMQQHYKIIRLSHDEWAWQMIAEPSAPPMSPLYSPPSPVAPLSALAPMAPLGQRQLFLSPGVNVDNAPNSAKYEKMFSFDKGGCVWT